MSMMLCCAAGIGSTADASPDLALACTPNNDLYTVLTQCKVACRRFDNAVETMDAASSAGGVLVLADGYPNRPTDVPPGLLARAKSKNVRLFVEYPTGLPGLVVGEPRKASVERAVVASDFFDPGLKRGRILAVNGLHFLAVESTDSHLVAARVAGFDTAVYGLPDQTAPLLLEHPQGDVLIATTMLSRFVSGRYAPQEAWQALWQAILRWLLRCDAGLTLTWTPAVHARYQRDEELPANAEQDALRRGTDWFIRSKLLVHESRAGNVGGQIPPPPSDAPVGDGSMGIMEAPLSIVQFDGSQILSSVRRGDCTAESAMALALGGNVLKDNQKCAIAENLLDFWHFHSDARKKERGDPSHPAYGLIAWGIDADAWYKANYGDDNARVLMATAAAAAVLRENRWDDALMRCLLANLRTTGPLGFRGSRIDIPALSEHGWRYFFEREVVHCSPHFETYLWACYLWAYQRTGFELFLQRAQTGLQRTMAQHTDGWKWTNGLAQERARIVLPLAWLVRVKDTSQHRAWLTQAVGGLLALQQRCGAIREELGPRRNGVYPPPTSNGNYGTTEASLIQKDGDPVADLLYTVNFALLGLHEAAAAADEAPLRRAEDKLVEFLCRAQAQSAAQPALDGGWFRAFDYARWEPWGSNADHGWGAWAIESGWTQGWITAVLAMRQMDTSLWDLVNAVTIERHFETHRTAMLPDEAIH